jgi:hypothetical protein
LRDFFGNCPDGLPDGLGRNPSQVIISLRSHLEIPRRRLCIVSVMLVNAAANIGDALN